MGITFGRPAPKIWDGEKKRPNSARFLTTFDFDREYLGTTPDVQIRKEMRSTAIPAAFHEKSR